MSSYPAGPSSQKNAPFVTPQKQHISIECDCGHEAARHVSMTPRNPNRPFYKCPERDCNFFKWEDEIPGPSRQFWPQAPSSSQAYATPAASQTPLRASGSTSSYIKTPWTSQIPTPFGTSVNKRKRSPPPPPSPSASTARAASGTISQTGPASFTHVFYGTETISSDTANLGAGTSASGRGRGDDFPAKRPRVDNASAGGSTLSEDEHWEEIDAQPLEPAREGKEEEATPSARPIKKSVSFQDLGREGWQDLEDEEGILVDAGKLKMLDFKNMRGPSPDRLVTYPVRDGTMDDFPIIDDDPSNPFRTNNIPQTAPIQPNASLYTPGRTPGTLSASSSAAGLPSTGSLSRNPSPAAIKLMAEFERLENGHPDIAAAFPEMKKSLVTLERKSVADAKSIQAKLDRIRALEEEVKELAALREENTKLRGENARLVGEGWETEFT